MTSRLQDDYSDVLYPVYFEVGEHEGVAHSVLQEFMIERCHAAGLPFEPRRLRTHRHGYELDLPTQLIPEVVRALASHNIAVYEVVRGQAWSRGARPHGAD